MNLTEHEIKRCHSIVFGCSIEDEAIIQQYMATYTNVGDLVAHFISTNEFISRNFYENAPSFLLSQSRYLFSDVTDKSCCDYYFYHHNYLCDHMSPVGYMSFIRDGVIVYQKCPDDMLYQVLFHQTKSYPFEGESSLSLLANGRPIFAMSFNIVRGVMFHQPTKSAILISRIQGAVNDYDSIRKATKELDEISPPHLLYSALIGVARALGVDLIGGVCGAKQVSHKRAHDDRFSGNYDGFFESIGAERTPEGFFLMGMSDQADTNRMVKGGHRSRTRRKRKMKADIARSVQVLSTLIFSPSQPSYYHDVKGRSGHSASRNHSGSSSDSTCPSHACSQSPYAAS